MLTLYPAIKPYATHKLAVDDIHTLYIEESGNPEGTPVLFLHGGPGAGCSPEHRRFFDPTRYRIVLFDQRGCGRSTPHAELENNTTQDLIADIEKIREQFGVEQWVLFGGSWGSTLALLYAQQYPANVTAMILRGIFLCRDQDLEWFYQSGASKIYPDYFEEFLEPLNGKIQENNIKSYYDLLTGEDDVARMAAAKTWCRWEASCSTLDPCPSAIKQFCQPHIAASMARIECHYFVNNIFIEGNSIINNMSKIKHIPGVIVHGRYDMVCTLDNALELYQHWPEAELNIIRDAGHSAFEPGIIDALVHATNILSR